MIEAGDHVLSVTKKSVDKRGEIATKHGSGAALAELLRQMGWDENQNGIPDWMEKQPMQQFGSESQQVMPKQNPQNPPRE